MVLVTCQNVELQNILYIVKRVINLIQLIGPILALISIVIILTRLMATPDNKKLTKALTNSIISLLVLFFIPLITDVIMNTVDSKTEVTSCWVNAKKISSKTDYIDNNKDKKKTSILVDSKDYKPGDEKHASSSSSNSSNSASVSKLLKAAKEVTDYVRNNGFSYGDAPINPAMDSSAKLTSCDRCVAWFLYKVGYTDQPRSHGLVVYDASGGRDLSTYLANKGFKKITDKSQLKAGDVMFVNPSGSGHPGHTFLLGNSVGNGIWERYDCGSNTRIHSNQPFKEGVSNFMYAYRMPNA